MDGGLQQMVQGYMNQPPNPEMASSSSATPPVNSQPNQADMNPQAEMNFQPNQAGQSQSLQVSPLLSKSTIGLMLNQPNNMLPNDASMRCSQPVWLQGFMRPPPNPEMASSSSATPPMNSQPDQAGQFQTLQRSSLPSSTIGLMHNQLNNSPVLPTGASMDCSPPISSDFSWHLAQTRQDYHIQSQNESWIDPSLPSQPNQVDRTQIDGQMSSELNTKQKKPQSQTAAAIRSRNYRGKRNDATVTLQTEKDKAMENERSLTEENKKLTAEKEELINKIERLEEEKVALISEKYSLTTNMTGISENIKKLASQYEALSQSISCRQQDEQTTTHNGQSDIQKIHMQLNVLTLNVLEMKTHVLNALKQWLSPLDGFRQSDAQSPTQNRLSNIARHHHAITSAVESQGCQQASTSCPQPNEPIQSQARQPTIEHIHPSTYSAKQQLAPKSFQTTQIGSQISSAVQDPQRTESISAEGGIVSSSHLTENQENSQATSMPMAELLNKVGEKGKSKANFSDFPCLTLDQDRVKVGGYNIPKSLESTAQKIMDEYGDVTKKSRMHHDVDERTFILLCSTMKEMEELQLNHVTEDCILKWSDTIKTALEISFDAEFLMDELEKDIVPYYFKSQALWDDLQQKYAKRRRQSME